MILPLLLLVCCLLLSVSSLIGNSDIIGMCAFGYNFNALETGKDQHPYVKAIYSCTDRVYDRAFRPWLYPNSTFNRSAIGKEYLYSCEVIHDVCCFICFLLCSDESLVCHFCYCRTSCIVGNRRRKSRTGKQKETRFC